MKTKQLATLCFTCLLGIMPIAASAQPYVISADGTEVTAQVGSSGLAWRLPNVKELPGIADKSFSNPAIDSTVFPAIPARRFGLPRPALATPTSPVSSISNLVASLTAAATMHTMFGYCVLACKGA